ncbi:hypothetical protein B4146_1973 [Bacillus subtilis]|uniref:Uncharacterized protein n=1 Tax=Bacillus subtilis TaxID=1423 RepID=A0AAP1HCD3_BACIU|nr:hypothetical protein B4146_1973 [Bacillus subtilis]KZD95165.1 hypothetical protein B4122_0137 [Bacillus subtilis]
MNKQLIKYEQNMKKAGIPLNRSYTLEKTAALTAVFLCLKTIFT